MNNLTEIIRLIKENQRFVLAGHLSPDGDCIGATIALGLALKKMGKEARIFLESFLPLFHYLEHGDMITTKPTYADKDEVVLLLDSSDKGRLGEGKLLLEGESKAIVNIDHHASNDHYGMYNYVESDASSTCEIIYKLIEELGVAIDRDIAGAIFTGIIYDTGVFKHPNTMPSTHLVAAKLTEEDIDASDIINRLFYTKSFVQSKLLGRALEQMELHFNGRVAFSSISIDEMNAYGGTVNDIDGIVQYIAQVESIELAVFLYEKAPGIVKASLRSKKTFDVANFASVFGGGGHVRASGCTLNGSIANAKEQILKSLEEYRSGL